MTAIGAIRIVSSDVRALAGFYERALGFRAAGEGGRPDPFVPMRRIVRLRLGDEIVEICEPDMPGAPVPPLAAGDPRFQHFAMIAPDLPTAMRRLDAEPGWTPITRGDPAHLPEASGGVTAFKFRDPEGHPLEVLSFPDGRSPARWRGLTGSLVGIDHTAIAVTDLARSEAHYAVLGFRRAAHTLNRGLEQARLDGAAHPVLDMVRLKAGPGIALELLAYRTPPVSAPPGDPDIAATRTVLRADAVPPRDPDGHRWIAEPEPQA